MRAMSRAVGFLCLAFALRAIAASAQPPKATPNPYTYVSHPVSTEVATAQEAFDRGLTLVFAYQNEEAEQAFRQAAKLDPSLAMAWWGIGLALGPTINYPPDPKKTRLAAQALKRAQSLAERHATSAEREYITALSQRYSADDQPDFDKLTVGYRNAMQAVVRAHPDDADAAALYAEALMDQRPWRLWSPDGQPAPDTEELVSTIERGLKSHPDHIGLLHFYIHAVEASPTPERALAGARRLTSLPMEPAAAHLVHMPAHIYLRVGDWQSAVDANEHSVHHALQFRQSNNPAQERACSHCLDFLAYAYSMQGNLAGARKAAEDYRLVEGDPTNAIAVLVRFQRWDDLLVFPEPPAEQRPDARNTHFTHGFWHYARGLALVATGRLDRADAELAELRREAALAPPMPTFDPAVLEVVKVFDKMMAAADSSILAIADRVLSARLAEARGNPAGAISLLREAVVLQDNIQYGEPPAWFYPVRENLGGALLRSGQAAVAEVVFRDDLKRTPHNGRSAFGLAEALKAQGKTTEAAAQSATFASDWTHADTQLTVAAL